MMERLYPTDEVAALIDVRGARLLKPGDPEIPKALGLTKGKAYLMPVNWKDTAQVVLHLPFEFPDECPTVYLAASAGPERVVPHINREGQICTLPVGTVVNPFRPAAQIVAVLENAQRVVEARYSPEQMLAEIERELVAYWGGGDPILILADDTLECHRVVHVRHCQEIQRTATRRVHFVRPLPTTIPEGLQVALVLNIPRPRLVEFLGEPAKVIGEEASWQEACGLLASILSRRNHAGKTITVFALANCETRSGAVWLAGLFSKSFRICKAEDINRDGLLKLPSRSRLQRCIVDSWRTERLLRRVEGPAVSAHLSETSVAFVGCGSVGSYMADLLVRSGVSRMLLVDKESLESANLARHVLNAGGVFLPKAEQLAQHFRCRFPEIKVEAHTQDIRHPDGIKKLADYGGALNVVATGDTNTDLMLSELCRCGAVGSCCFVWVEAGLRAGHIVYQPRGCPRTLLDLHGPGDDGRHLYVHRLIRDPEQAQCQEHACQFTFTPYSAVDAVSFAAAATRKVINWLSHPPQEMQILRWRMEVCDGWEPLDLPHEDLP